MIGRALGHYRISAAIGAGGMGEVYRATDTKLGRDVALKVLPAEMASSPDMLERFRREARAVAALNHPNIVTIYSVEEADGLHFLTMELIEGQSLDRLIPESGMDVPRIIDIASALSGALAAAHDRGIVHRDLKPANVMLTSDASVKVLDFGLAKFQGPDATGTDSELSTELHTQRGVVMGTRPYMSPEQVQGQALDHRTDIFSLGVVLYEMTTGRRPFQGHSSADLFASILRDRVPPVTDLRADLPPDLVRVIRRCLEKDPRQRIQTARDVGNELRDTARVGSQRDSIEPARAASSEGSGGANADQAFRVAVLPFKYTGANNDLTTLAEGISEEIVTGLSRFSYLKVIARGSTLRYAKEEVDVCAVGKQIGARYVIEGSLRQAGPLLRVAVQLVDVASGAHLWAETYDRPFDLNAIFALQDDLVPRIVSSVADAHGILPHTMSEALRSKDPDQLTPYEAVLRSFGYGYRRTPEEHAIVRAGLERAVQQAPAYADGWAMLSLVISEEHAFGFNVKPDPLGRTLEAARRAADTAPSNAMANNALARALFFRKEFQAFRIAAERALELNPMNGPTLAGLGTMMAYAGDWEHGCALVERAAQLHPRHPGWYWFPLFYDAYRKGDYRGALGVALKINLPHFFYTHVATASAYGQLAEPDAAGKALRELLTLRPDFAATAREELLKWYDPALVEHLLEGLRKAGLAIASQPESGTVSIAADASPSSSSGATRAAEGFWVAVLPFKYTGGNTDLTALAEGMSEEIVTGLSRFSYLRVIARSSTSRYASGAVDVRAIGKQIGARYVMEGSLRQAGSRLRLAVQLADATTGAHLWAETYERPFSADDVFALQDDLVPRIVSTVADQHGVLLHSMGNLIRNKSDDQVTPHEAVLRVFGFHERMSPEEHASVRALLERSVRDAPGEGDCWAMLATIYTDEYMFGFNAQPDPLGRGQAAAQRAVEIAPSNWLACQALAQSLFFRREWQAFRPVAERTIALNRMDGASSAFMGILLALSGAWERGCEVANAAIQLNPHHPGWYWLAAVFGAYHKRDYRASVDAASRINIPGYFWGPATSAAAFGQLGEREQAQKAVKELLAIRPDFAAAAREEFGKWFDPELVEHYLEGLLKAGLEPASAAVAERGSVAIAVLPFSDMSPAKDQEYLCEGMAEEIMNALVRIDGIRVASRTSAFRARRDGGDLPAIARALSVGHVLEGSVRTSGSRLRVTAQLTDVASGYQLWSERFDRDAADVFAVQDEISAGVVEAVRARLAPGASAIHARPQARNLDAYRSYLKGRHLRGKEHHAGAIAAYEEAIRLDPSHAASWTGLAESMVLSAHFNVIPAREACAAARKAVATAVELEGESANTLHVEAFVALIERRWQDMETAWRRAIELQPSHVLALGSFGISLCARERFEEGFAFLARAREADPLASFPCMLTGFGMLECGRVAEGQQYLEDALSFEKEDAAALYISGAALVALGRMEEGIANIRHGVDVTGRAAHFLGMLGWALATAGRNDEARVLLDELRARPKDAPTVAAEAWLLGALGETDASFDVIARAEDEYQANLYYTGFPGFNALRADPRFAALRARLELSPTAAS